MMGDQAVTLDLADGFDAARYCRLMVTRWEHPQADSALALLRSRFPDALLYWHNPASSDLEDHTCPDPEPATGFVAADCREWYVHARDTYGLAGVLLQIDPWRRDLARSLEVMRKVRAVVPPELDLVLFETDIYVKFWDAVTEAEGVAYNNALLQEPSLAGMYRGFGSGSTIPRESIRDGGSQ
jgi:hypothetical protein